MPTSILVIGLGELGEEVVKSLAIHPKLDRTRIAVLVRSEKPGYLHSLDGWDVEAVSGDVVQESQDDLAGTFAKHETVICCTGMYTPPETQIKIARAILAAAVKRSRDLFDSQLDVRDILRSQSKTAWGIVSTGTFISFLFEPNFGLVNAEQNAVTGIGSWEDIGRNTAEIALGHPEAQCVVYTAGDTTSLSRLVDVVETVPGKGVTRKLKTAPHLQAEFVEDPSDGMRKYRVVFGGG